MVSKSEITEAMQFSGIFSRDAINATGDARMTLTWQYAGTSQPGDFAGGSYSGWTAFEADEKAAFAAVLTHIETFLNVDFIEVTGDADPDINVGQVTLPGNTTGTGGYSLSSSGNTITRWDSFVVYDNTLDLSLDARTSLLLHEMGHALGLQHTFSTGILSGEEDTQKYSVMAYSDNPDNGTDSDAMMLYDTYALQDIWGAVDYLTGDTAYTGSRTDTVDTIWDTGGVDILDASGRGGGVILDLNEGAFSTFDSYPDVVIAFGVRIENATGGAGADSITGNQFANVLLGGQGDDTISGGAGRDQIRGGIGDDAINGGSGRDRLFGEVGKDVLLGKNNNDTLKGGDGRDVLMGGKGNDRLFGEGGNDLLIGNQGADRFVFALNGDRDKIRDFEDGVDVIKFIGLGDAASVLSVATEIGADVVFDFGGGDILTVLNMTKADISDDVLA